MKPRVRRLLGVALAGLAIAAGYDAFRIAQAREQNALIAANVPVSPEERRPDLVFASAARAAEDGDYLRALTLYRQIQPDAPAHLRIAARFNSANLHFREAVRMRESDNPAAAAQSLPLLELAKVGYREVLRDNPAHWDARYNLERTLRLAPEGDQPDDDAAPPPLNNERAATTMKGFTMGLP